MSEEHFGNGAERTIARIRSHGRNLALPVAVIVASVGAGSYASWLAEEQWLQFIVIVATVGVIGVVGVSPLLVWLTTRWTVTSHRVIARSGILVISRREIAHLRRYDVAVERTLLQRVFGSGTIRLVSGDTVLVLRDVPAANELGAALRELVNSTGDRSDRQ